MSTQHPIRPNENKTLDRIVTALGGLAIVLLGGALIASYFPKVPSTAIQYTRYAGFAAIALFFVLSLVQNRDFLKDLAGRRTTQNGANSLVQTIAFIAIVALLNWFGTRYHSRLDLTTNHQFSLSDQSKKIAKGLKTDLKLTAFVRGGDQQGRGLKDLMDEYKYQTDHLKLEIIDPDREPGKVKMFLQAHPDFKPRTNALIVDNNGKLTEAQSVSEQDLTAALLKATQDKQLTVYFLTGHGEADTDAFQQDGMSQAKDALQKQNYIVKKLSLFETKGQVPADCDVLVVAGPRTALMPQDLSAIEGYVKKGGKLYAMLTPGTDTGLETIAKEYGVTVENDLAVDPRANLYGDPAAPVVQTYPNSPITQGLRPTIYPAARSLDIDAKAPTGVTVSSLAETSDESFSKRNLKDRSPTFNPSVDKKGPLKLAVSVTIAAASGSAQPNRMMVVGNTQFAGNAFYTGAGNGDFFLNSVNWLAEQDQLVSIPPKAQDQRTVFLTGQQQNTIFLSTVAGAPVAMLFAGGLVWWRRRRS